MTKEDWHLGAIQPQDIFIIDSVDTLKVVADPLRLKIVELLRSGPHTVKQLGAALHTPLKKLYYHVNLLEEHGLIRVVSTRVVSGIIEKQYQVTAYRLSVDRALLAPDDSGGDSLDAFLSMILDHAKSEIKKGVRAGLIEVSEGKSLQERGLLLGRRWIRMSPARADEFLLRLKELEREFETPRADEETLLYEILLGLYPTEPPDNE
jgi:DNA-binding transcriptional ArsR family regulator